MSAHYLPTPLPIPQSYEITCSLLLPSFGLLHERNCMICDLSLSIMFSVLIQVVAGVSTSFLSWGEHSSMHFVCPILYWWTLWDFYLMAFMNNYAIEWFFCVDIFFISLEYIPSSEIVVSRDNSFVYLRNWETQSFPKWQHHFVFPPAMRESSNFSVNTC